MIRAREHGLAECLNLIYFLFIKGETAMNSIESGALSSAAYDSAAVAADPSGINIQNTAAETALSTNGTSATAATAAGSVSPELQASKQLSQTQRFPPNDDQFSMLSRVVEALVSVVTAVVGLVSSLVGQRKGTSTNLANGLINTSGGTAVASSGNTASTSTSNITSGQTSGVVANQAGTIVRSALDVNRNDAGMITVRTLDGFTVRAEGRDQAWSITGPDGRTTRIWGDPHVSESDGDKWDFLNRSTFMFGKNKATVEVVPAGNGETLSARLTIYSDYERVTIDGIDKDQPTVVAASSDGLQHDAGLADGQIYKRALTANGEVWVSTATGKAVPVKR